MLNRSSPGLPVDFPGILRRLLARLGPQRWWPARSAFEVCVGAVLTQNTAWINVERAISNLRRDQVLHPERIHKLSHSRLARLLRPSGYFNVKARRLQAFVRAFRGRFGGSITRMKHERTEGMRDWLLGISGVGRETADSILLYALQKPVFVVDAYTRRIFARHGWIRGDEDYDQIRRLVESAWHNKQDDILARDYNEFHALLVAVGKKFCRPKTLHCGECPLSVDLPARGPVEFPKKSPCKVYKCRGQKMLSNKTT